MTKSFVKVGLIASLLMGSISIATADCTPADEAFYKDEILNLMTENKKLKAENDLLKKKATQKKATQKTQNKKPCTHGDSWFRHDC